MQCHVKIPRKMAIKTIQCCWSTSMHHALSSLCLTCCIGSVIVLQVAALGLYTPACTRKCFVASCNRHAHCDTHSDHELWMCQRKLPWVLCTVVEQNPLWQAVCHCMNRLLQHWLASMFKLLNITLNTSHLCTEHTYYSLIVIARVSVNRRLVALEGLLSSWHG